MTQCANTQVTLIFSITYRLRNMYLLWCLLVIIVDELWRSLDDLKDGEGALWVGLRAIAHVLAEVTRAQVLVEPLRGAQSRVQSAKKEQ